VNPEFSKLSIVVPVRNEQNTIGTLLHRVRSVDFGMPAEIIVVDGASTDGTRDVLQELDFWPELVLVLEDEARGKGYAVRSGFARATGDIVVIQDADLELDPGQIPMLMAPILDGTAAAVLGSRFKGRGRQGAPFVNYLGNKILTWFTNVMFFCRLTDILTCYKVLPSQLAQRLDLECNGFDFDAEITCRLLRDGHAIEELPVTYRPRSVDEGKKLTPRVGWSVLKAIIRVRMSAPTQSAPTSPITTP